MYRLFLLSMLTQLSVASFNPYLQIILRNKEYAYSTIGVILSLCQLAAIIIPILVSFFTSRYQKTKPFILLAILLSILTVIPFIAANNIIIVALSVVIMNGFFWCFNPLVDGFLNRSLKGDSSRYSIVRAAGTLTYVTGLTLFGITGFPNEKDNYSMLKCILFVLTLYLLVTLLNQESREKGEEKDDKRQFFSVSWFPKKFYLYMFLVGIYYMGMSVIDRYISTYMTEVLGFGSYFSVFIALGAATEAVLMIVGGRMLKKGMVTRMGLFRLACLTLVGRLGFYLLPGIVPFTIAQMTHGITFGLFHVATTDFIAKEVSPKHYELGTTFYWSCGVNLPVMFGSLIGGYVIEYLGYRVLFPFFAVFPLIAFLLSLVFGKELKKNA